MFFFTAFVSEKIVNDSISGDPLFTVPLMGGAKLCYDIVGRPGIVLNLLSDKCTSVSAEYEAVNTPTTGNTVSAIGIKAVGFNARCHNIEVRLVRNDNNGKDVYIKTSVDNVTLSRNTQMDGIRVRTYFDRVRISIPNCNSLDLVMWIIKGNIGEESMLNFVISRGQSLTSTAHGLIGMYKHGQQLL